METALRLTECKDAPCLRHCIVGVRTAWRTAALACTVLLVLSLWCHAVLYRRRRYVVAADERSKSTRTNQNAALER